MNELHAGQCWSLVQLASLRWSDEVGVGRQGLVMCPECAPADLVLTRQRQRAGIGAADVTFGRGRDPSDCQQVALIL